MEDLVLEIKTMELEQIKKLYPGFKVWAKEKYNYATVDGIHLLHLWYRFLEEKKNEQS